MRVITPLQVLIAAPDVIERNGTVIVGVADFLT
jgi:hypothetical protein